jgi:hypothetical protein
MLGMRLILVVPVALAIFAVVLTRRRRTGPKNLPPGPPGHDHAGYLEGHRWNTFKAWNDQYGLAFLFFRSDGLMVDVQRYRLRGVFLCWTAAQHRYFHPDI